MTYRTPRSITWNVLSVDSVTTSAAKVAMDTLVSSSFSNLKHIKLDEATIASLKGKSVDFQVSAQNFFYKTATKRVLVYFLSTKKIRMEGHHSSYILTANQDHKFFISASIPICSTDNATAILEQERSIIISCQLYNSNATILRATLSNCLVPANTMSYPNTYKMKFVATNPSDSSMTTTHWTTINIKNSDLVVFIDGGDRKINIKRTNTFLVNVEPKNSNLVYRWSCLEEDSGSYCLSPDNSYIVFPNNETVHLEPDSIFPNKEYLISCTVIDLSTQISSKHSVKVEAAEDSTLEVVIESRHNKNGYINTAFLSLFNCKATVDGEDIDISTTTYTWTLTDSLGNLVDLTPATQVLNGLKIPENTFYINEYYTIKVDVSYLTYTGTSSITYSTSFETLYELDIEPLTGVSLKTEFFLSISSQSLGYEINEFSFGYIKSGKKYMLTRSSSVPIHTLLLPQGETSDLLTLFCEIKNMQGKSYFLEKTITVSAPTLLPSELNTILNNLNCDSINDSVRLRLQYEYLRTSLASSYKLKAIELMLDGLQRDGTNLQENQDDPSRLTVAQTLESLSLDFLSLGQSSIIIRAVDIFHQTVVIENSEINTIGRALEFSTDSLNSFFNFGDHILSAIGTIDISHQESVKTKIQEGIEYAFRGSLSNEPAGNAPINLQGTSISASAVKINVDGLTDSSTTTFTSPQGTDVIITIPKTVAEAHNYLQLISIMTNDQVYSTKSVNAGSSLKTGMLKVTLDQTEASMSVSESKVKSSKMNVANLTDPIVIEIPFEGKIQERDTLSCVYSKKSGDIISSEGISTLILDNSVK